MSGTVVVTNKAEALQAAVEGEKQKVDLTKATWLDKQLVEELRGAIRDRARLKKKEDDLELEKGNVIAQIEVLLDTIGISAALDPRVGSVTKYPQSRANLDKSRLKEELMKAGMPAEKVVKCFDKATKYSSSTVVKFTPA